MLLDFGMVQRVSSDCCVPAARVTIISVSHLEGEKGGPQEISYTGAVNFPIYVLGSW